MAKRHSRTAAQQCRYYEVDNIFEYMAETYINGNFSTFQRLYKELCKDARKDFMERGRTNLLERNSERNHLTTT